MDSLHNWEFGSRSAVNASVGSGMLAANETVVAAHNDGRHAAVAVQDDGPKAAVAAQPQRQLKNIVE